MLYWYKANKNWLFIIIALLFVASVPAVLGYAQNDTFVYDNISQPETLDPGWAFDTASFISIQQLYEPLLTYKGGKTDEFVPVLAESYTVSADGLTYTFKIRSGVKFHDGSDLTAADVAYSIQRIIAIDRDGGSAFLHLDPLLDIGSTRDNKGNLLATAVGKPLNEAICNAVTTPDANTVVFHLAKPFAPYPQVLAGGQSHIISKSFTIAQAKAQNKTDFGGCPLSADDLKKVNNPDDPSKLALFTAANGTGPFKLVNWDQAQKIVTLAKNDSYPGNRNNGPAASFKNLIFKEVDENTTRYLELGNGAADFVDANRADIPQVEKIKDVLVVDDLPGLVVAVFNFNFDIKGGDKNPLIGSGKCDGKGVPTDFWRDANVRKAFALSFDHDTYVRDIFLGKAISPATPDVKGLPYYDGNVKGITFNREAARAAFAAAKCGTAKDAPALNSVGFTFTARFNNGNLARQAAGNLLKLQVESFNRNYHINVEGVPFADILKQIADGTLPTYILGWAPDYIDDSDYIDQWVGSNAHGASFSGPGSIDKLPEWGTAGKTKGGVEYKNWDELLDKGKSTADSNVRKDIYSWTQQLYVDNAIGIPLSQPSVFSVQRSSLDGWYYNPGFPSNEFPPLNNLAKGTGKGPNKADICTNYSTATFNLNGTTTKC
ncbi:hypothetical protein HY230_06945 [Candidatus Acetothermia bacterium]|nr:hypothetical protein [Candidatus Acetothermia bacterium]